MGARRHGVEIFCSSRGADRLVWRSWVHGFLSSRGYWGLGVIVRAPSHGLDSLGDTLELMTLCRSLIPTHICIWSSSSSVTIRYHTHLPYTSAQVSWPYLCTRSLMTSRTLLQLVKVGANIIPKNIYSYCLRSVLFSWNRADTCVSNLLVQRQSSGEINTKDHMPQSTHNL